jgi:hypothetical protein
MTTTTCPGSVKFAANFGELSLDQGNDGAGALRAALPLLDFPFPLPTLSQREAAVTRERDPSRKIGRAARVFLPL